MQHVLCFRFLISNLDYGAMKNKLRCKFNSFCVIAFQYQSITTISSLPYLTFCQTLTYILKCSEHTVIFEKIIFIFKVIFRVFNRSTFLIFQTNFLCKQIARLALEIYEIVECNCYIGLRYSCYTNIE